MYLPSSSGLRLLRDNEIALSAEVRGGQAHAHDCEWWAGNGSGFERDLRCHEHSLGDDRACDCTFGAHHWITSLGFAGRFLAQHRSAG